MKNLIEQISELKYQEEINVICAGKSMIITCYSENQEGFYYAIKTGTGLENRSMNIDFFKGRFIHFYNFDMFGNKSQCKVNINQFKIW